MLPMESSEVAMLGRGLLLYQFTQWCLCIDDMMIEDEMTVVVVVLFTILLSLVIIGRMTCHSSHLITIHQESSRRRGIAAASLLHTTN